MTCRSTLTRPKLARNMLEIVCDDVSWSISGKSEKNGTQLAQKICMSLEFAHTQSGKRQGRHKGRDVVRKMFRGKTMLQDAVASEAFHIFRSSVTDTVRGGRSVGGVCSRSANRLVQCVVTSQLLGFIYKWKC